MTSPSYLYVHPFLTVAVPGCHADVGGDSVEDELPLKLSHISLRWMIKECKQKTKISFIDDVLLELGFDLKASLEDLTTPKITTDITPNDEVAQQAGGKGVATTLLKLLFPRDQTDVAADLYNQLLKAPLWWIIECIPTLATYQTEDGHWTRRRW